MTKLNPIQQMMVDTDMLSYELPVTHDETETHFEAVVINLDCEHVCSSDCRREGCNCTCGEWHLTV